MTFKVKDGLQQDDRIVIDSATNVTAKSFFIGSDTVQDTPLISYYRLKGYSPFSSYPAQFSFTRTGSLLYTPATQAQSTNLRVYFTAAANIGATQGDRLNSGIWRGEPIEEAITNFILQSNTINNNAWMGYKLTSTNSAVTGSLFGTTNLFVPSAIGLTQANYDAYDEVSYTTAGTYSWTVPTGITSVSVLTIGAGGGGRASQGSASNAAGGGGGGDLRYYNTLAVTPGEVLTIIVGAGGTAGVSPTAGGDTSIKRGATTLLLAVGGPAGGATAVGTRGTSTAISGSIGGSTGGQGGYAANYTAAFGGGGASGYSNQGGLASSTPGNVGGSPGTGGGGGGGGSGSTNLSLAGGGGGVNIWGSGNTGTGGSGSTTQAGQGGGGSYSNSGTDITGLNGAAAYLATSTNPAWQSTYGLGQHGGLYGGGGGGDDSVAGLLAGTGGVGAVRIIWNKNNTLTRTFPSSNTMNDGRHYAYQTAPITITSGVRYGFSFYAKANGYNYVRGYLPASGVFSADQTAYFDLSAGTVISSSGATGYIQKFYDGWYRCTVSTTAATATGSAIPRIYVGINSADEHFIGDGTSGVYISQAQLETSFYPTSPIITTTSSTTRGAAVASLNSSFVSSYPSAINYSEFTIGIQGYVFEFDSVNNNSNSPRIINISDGTTNNGLVVARGVAGNANANYLVSALTIGGVAITPTGSVAGTLVANGSRFSAAISYSASAKKMYVIYNGDSTTLQIFDFAAYTLPTWTTTYFGSNRAGTGGFWNGELGQVFTVGRAVTPAQLLYLSQQLYNEDN